MYFLLRCTNLSDFHRWRELTATPSPTLDIQYMSVGVLEKWPIVPDCPEALRLAHGGRSTFHCNHFFNLCLTMLDFPHCLMTPACRRRFLRTTASFGDTHPGPQSHVARRVAP